MVKVFWDRTYMLEDKNRAYSCSETADAEQFDNLPTHITVKSMRCRSKAFGDGSKR